MSAADLGTPPSVPIARIQMWQAVAVAAISGIFGVLGACAQLQIKKPATLDEAHDQATTVISKQLPVGTIVASMLKPSQFAKVAGDNGDFDPRTSIWIPADGRTIAGSRYIKETENSKVPDLRGMFLRGLNAFEADNPRGDQFEDPDMRNVGQLQKNAIAEHFHKFVLTVGDAAKAQKAPTHLFGVVNRSTSPTPTPTSGTFDTQPCDTCAKESRPNNIAIYYYIKIN